MGDETFKLRLEGDSLRQRHSRKLHLFMYVCTSCGAQPEPTQSICRLKVRLILSSITSARSLTARQSLPRQLQQNVWWLLALALSAWKLPHRCARGILVDVVATDSYPL